MPVFFMISDTSRIVSIAGMQAGTENRMLKLYLQRLPVRAQEKSKTKIRILFF